jgi:hypothetical protein
MRQIRTLSLAATRCAEPSSGSRLMVRVKALPIGFFGRIGTRLTSILSSSHPPPYPAAPKTYAGAPARQGGGKFGRVVILTFRPVRGEHDAGCLAFERHPAVEVEIPEATVIITADRDQERNNHPAMHMAGFTGMLRADGYAGFEKSRSLPQRHPYQNRCRTSDQQNRSPVALEKRQTDLQERRTLIVFQPSTGISVIE